MHFCTHTWLPKSVLCNSIYTIWVKESQRGHFITTHSCSFNQLTCSLD